MMIWILLVVLSYILGLWFVSWIDGLVVKCKIEVSILIEIMMMNIWFSIVFDGVL